MDQKLIGLISTFQEKGWNFYISCIVNGVLITGFIINEQNFFVEMNRLMQDSLIQNDQANPGFEELFLSIAQMPVENACLHLAGVSVHAPSGIVRFETIRIDPSQISAWNFLLPTRKSLREFLPKFFENLPEK